MNNKQYCKNRFLFISWEGGHEWQSEEKPKIWKDCVMITNYKCRKCSRKKREMFSPYNPEKCITYS